MEPKDLGDFLLSRFRQHVLILVVCTRTAEESVPEFFSGFVLAVDGGWFWVTAGHCIQRLKEICASAPDGGYDSCYFIDNPPEDRSRWRPLPFDLRHSPLISIEDDSLALDYGFVPLRPIYVANLRLNLHPVTENEVRESHTDGMNLYLIGVPGESVRSTLLEPQIVGAHYEIALAPVEVLQAEETEFQVKDARAFYGRLCTLGQFSSIRGMSGGAIFALQKVNGGIRYWLIALQSTWIKSMRQIRGCRVRYLVDALRHEIEWPS